MAKSIETTTGAMMTELIIDRIQTQTANLIITDTTCYKYKQPVYYPGLFDYRSFVSRKRAIRYEYGLNSQFYPDIYQGVTLISTTADQITKGTGNIHALTMKRFHSSDFVSPDKIAHHQLLEIWSELTRIHARSRPIPGQPNNLIPILHDRIDAQCDEVENLLSARDFNLIRKRLKTLLSRATRTKPKLVYLHGDMHSGNIVQTNSTIALIDLLDINRNWRYGVAAADYAAITVELLVHDRCDLLCAWQALLKDPVDDPAWWSIYGCLFALARAACEQNSQKQKHYLDIIPSLISEGDSLCNPELNLA